MGSENTNYASLAGIVFVAFVGYLLSFPSAEIQPVSVDSWVRLVLFALLAFGWVIIARKLAAPTAATIADRKKRLQAAVSSPNAKGTGINEEWYDSASALIESVSTILSTAVALVLVYGFAKAYPQASTDVLAQHANEAWANLVNTYDHKDIFVNGICGVFLVTYWGVVIIFGILDHTQPTILMPFKIQEAEVVTWYRQLRALPLVLVNHVILYGAVLVFWEMYQVVNVDGFSPELPGLFYTLVELLCFVGVAEVFFYFPHHLLHTNAWLFQHVHSWHHSVTAPFAMTAIYSHPLEFIIGNIPVVGGGPLILGAHMSTFLLWTFAAVLQTCLAHSGWQLPFFGGNQSHDYHHKVFVPADGAQNLGVLGCLDHLLGTDRGYEKSWQYTVNVGYHGPDYPIDKVLDEPAVQPPSITQMEYLRLKKAAKEMPL